MWMQYIPASYIPNEYQKLDIYKRIAGIETEEEMDDMIEELIDRFGDIPKKSSKASGDCEPESDGTPTVYYGSRTKGRRVSIYHV